MVFLFMQAVFQLSFLDTFSPAGMAVEIEHAKPGPQTRAALSGTDSGAIRKAFFLMWYSEYRLLDAYQSE